MGVMLPATRLLKQVARPSSLILAALLWGCAPEPTVRPPPPDPSLEPRALDAAEAGDSRLAAQLYERLAEQSSGSARVDFLLAAARQHLAGDDLEAAAARLEMARSPMTAGQSMSLALLQADLALRRDQPELTLTRLEELPEPPPTGLRPDALGLKGQAQLALGRFVEGIATLVEREAFLARPEDVLATQRIIWAGLAAMPLSESPAVVGDPVMEGWLALQPTAAAARGNPFILQRALEDWSARFPGHPAGRMLLDDLLLNAQLMTRYPAQIALLLPLSGRQQAAATAVRDGLVAAYLSAAVASRPQLRIYDTTLLGPTEAYLQAEQDGADFIVGPLLKSAVEAVLSNAGRVATLTLNMAGPEQATPPNLFQFALAPEDEAAQVARRAIADGQTRALALIANSDWGIRVLTSFRNEFENLGGTLLEFKGFDPRGQDFSAAITALLQLDQSNQRQRRLAANLGQPLEFQPRRRQDVDLIFLAAAAPAARLLRPQLRFHYAGDLPTYATSEVYAPGDRRSNRDLNGIRFPAMPWLVNPDDAAANLRQAIEGYWPQRGARLIRLYAMGFDAYRLLPLLYNDEGGELSLRLEGLSGLLTKDPRGRIHRELAWAEFRAGQLAPAENLTESDDLETESPAGSL
jgi:outer membrane PBP1 activator LpoA protein